MSRHFKLSVLILIVLLFGLVASQVLAYGGSISGNVTNDSSGQPLAGAVVVAKEVGHFYGKEAKTDSSGNYTISGLEPGDYIVAAFKEGFNFEFFNNTQNNDSATIVPVNAEQNTPNINFSLTPKSEPQPGSISGNVTDESTGLPLENAFVVARQVEHYDGKGAETDSLGNYTISGLDPGDYIVKACKCDFQCEFFNNTQDKDSATVVPVVAGQNTPDINFSLSPQVDPEEGSISGNVTDESTGLPLAGAVVVAKEVGHFYGAEEALTDSSGNYTISDLDPGDYIVVAFKEGFNFEFFNNTQNNDSATIVPVLAGQNTPDINFSLTPKEPINFGSISGTVTDFDTGLPIPEAFVAAINLEEDHHHHYGDHELRARTDSLGNYTLEKVEPGKYKVVAFAFGFNFEVFPETVVVNPGEHVTGINFQLKKKQTGGIAGSVTEKGSGLPLHALVLAHQIEGRGFGHAFTDETGHYLIENLPEGEYKVIAFAREHHPAVFPEPVPVIGGQITDGINFELELLPLELTGVISGTVIDDSTSAPISQDLIVAFAKDDFGHHIVRFTFSHEDGSYELTHLPRIPFFVAAWAKGYMAELFNNAHRLDDATLVTPDASGIDFALTRKAEHPLVAGGNIFFASNGTPLGGVFVNTFGAGGILAGASFSLPDGGYILDGLSFENYNLEITTTQGTTPISTVDLTNGDNLTANLSLAGGFRGDVTGDGNVNLGDLIAMVNAIFKSMNPPPVQVGDVNCDNQVNLGDIVYLVNFVFKGASAPCNP